MEDCRLHVAISFFPLEESESVYVGKILSNVKKKKITGLAKRCVQASPALQGSGSNRNCVPSFSDGTVPLGMEWSIGSTQVQAREVLFVVTDRSHPSTSFKKQDVGLKLPAHGSEESGFSSGVSWDVFPSLPGRGWSPLKD